MYDRYEKIIDSFTHFAEHSSKVYAMIIIGSQARTDHSADEYSDLDMVLIVDDLDYFVASNEWLDQICESHVSFIEDSIDGTKEHRVLVENALDVDIVIRHISTVSDITTDEVAKILSNGYKVVIDKIGIDGILQTIKPNEPTRKLPSEKEYANTVNDFWYHAVWTSKKLKRGELWTAKFCVDSYMKWKLLTMIEWHSQVLNGSDFNTWYGGRFIEEWAEPWIIAELSFCFSHYNNEDMKSALFATMELFRKIAVVVAEELRYEYPLTSDKYATDWVKTNLEAPNLLV